MADIGDSIMVALSREANQRDRGGPAWSLKCT